MKASLIDQRMIKAQFPTEKERSRIERQYGGTAITGYCAPIINVLELQLEILLQIVQARRQ
jgi:hypothetical protein